MKNKRLPLQAAPLAATAKIRLDINRSLLAVAFTVFALVTSLKPELLQQSLFVPIQLTLSIPLFLSSILARSRLAHTSRPKMWEAYGFTTYLIAYAFLINVLGIVLTIVINQNIGMLFFLSNIVLSTIYSVLEVLDDRRKILSRINKDCFFILILLLGGIFPALALQ